MGFTINEISQFPDHIKDQIEDRTNLNRKQYNPDVRDDIRRQKREQLTTFTGDRQTITVDLLAPGLNGENGLKRMPFYEYIKIRDKWCNRISLMRPGKHEGEVVVDYVRISTQPMDWDNLGSSFKIPGDALEQLGVIRDDSRSTIIDFNMDWQKAGSQKEQRTVITLINKQNR